MKKHILSILVFAVSGSLLQAADFYRPASPLKKITGRMTPEVIAGCSPTSITDLAAWYQANMKQKQLEQQQAQQVAAMKALALKAEEESSLDETDDQSVPA